MANYAGVAKIFLPILKLLLESISPLGGKLIATAGIVAGLGHYFSPLMGMERPPISIAWGFLAMVFIGIIFGTKKVHAKLKEDVDSAINKAS